MTTQIVLGVAIGFLVLGVASWIASEARRTYSPPKKRVASRIYRLLESARDRLFKGSQDVRFTVFVPNSDGSALIPYARIGWGQPSADSEIAFAPGEGLAGLAVEKPEGILIARFGPFEDLAKAREAHRVVFGLRREQADFLSDMQLRATVLMASSLRKGRLFKGVLCFDSLDPALVPMDADRTFWNALDHLAAELADALPEPESAAVEKERIKEDPGSLVTVSQVTLENPLRPSQGSIAWPGVLPTPQPSRLVGVS